MFENRRMFDGLDPETGKYENCFHLASIVGLLGPPPPEFLQRSEYSSVYFDDKGKPLILRTCIYGSNTHTTGNWKCVNRVLPVFGRIVREISMALIRRTFSTSSAKWLDGHQNQGRRPRSYCKTLGFLEMWKNRGYPTFS